MAKLVEEHIVIKVSYLVKEIEEGTTVVTQEQRLAIEETVGELFSGGVVVEVIE